MTNKEYTFGNKDAYMDFMLDAENQGRFTFWFEGKKYKCDGEDVKEFIRDYNYDTYADNRDIDEAIIQGLIQEINNEIN